MPNDGNLLELGDDSQDVDSPQGADAPPAPEGGEGDAPKVSDRPEYVPDKFWDAEKGEMRVEDVFKSYSELEKKLTEAGKQNQAPEEYEVKVPEKYADTLEIPEDDAMMNAYKSFAKDRGFTQKQFDDNLEFFVDFMNSKAVEEQEAELEELGGKEKATEQIKKVRLFLKSRLSPESYNTLVATSTTAAQIKALDELRKLASVQSAPPDDPASDVSDNLTEQDLRALMKKPEYHDPSKRDHNLVKKVEDGFKKLYGNNKG